MLFDLVFFGCPLVLGLVLVSLAVREDAPRYWRPAFSFLAYSAFYLAGGREVLVFLVTALVIGGGTLSAEWAMIP